ncbi:MAG: glycosyltransferase family 4 protein [Pseudomonadota bacterium]
MQGGTRSYELARRLVEKGHQVDLITTDRVPRGTDDRQWKLTSEKGINVHWYPVPYSNNMGFFDRVRAFFSFARAATAKAGEMQADIVFATSTPLTIAIPGAVKSWRSKIPMVFEVRDLWPELPIAIGALRNPVLKLAARLLERFAYRNSEAIVALSPGMRAGIVATGYDPDRVCIIPNACDNAAFVVEPEKVEAFRKERDWLGDRPLLLYAGTLGEINGVGYLVEIAKQLEKLDSPTRILIVGDGKEKEKISKQAEDAGVLGKNLFMENSLPKSEMPVLFGAADISSSLFIDLPEMQANSANKFFDTLAAGRPILINYGGWHSKIIEQSGAGLVTWQNSPDAVAREIDRHIQDEAWLEKASTASKKLSREYFDRDQLAADFESALLIASERRGTAICKVNELGDASAD